VFSFAREAGLELAVRSGGHSSAGHGTTDSGIVIDLSRMKGLEVDEDRRTAWVETGITAGEYTATLGEGGLATGLGDTGSVGLGGITLAGGIGYLVRKNGLTIDDLLAADVVTADGELVRTSDASEPDLFWAIRGGGGNFGVVTRLQLRLHEVSQIVGGTLILPATPEVITGFLEAAEAAPEELSTIANVALAPPVPFIPEDAHGKPILIGRWPMSGESSGAVRCSHLSATSPSHTPTWFGRCATPSSTQARSRRRPLSQGRTSSPTRCRRAEPRRFSKASHGPLRF
jgi:FAD/FMN-containing dehydrogenase